jgi:endonuclease/exonuclease/phosphatase family metal-dependent hydrolase
MNGLLTGTFAPRRWGSGTPSVLKVVNWNIERGLRLPAVTDFLASQNADLLTLQEVDLNARRTRRLNIAEEIARRLGMNYVFAREFEELTQGSIASPAYHGQATLSRWQIANPRVVRFRRQSNFWRPRWFIPHISLFQERIGGRIALVTDIEFAGSWIRVYNLHLESRGDNDLRTAQLDEVLEDAGKREPGSPALVAGDLNFDASAIVPGSSRTGLNFRSALQPMPAATTPPSGLFSRGHRIDWAFVSGSIKADQGCVHNRINASDHYPLSFRIKAS